MSVKTILKLNKRFRLPEHPFNAAEGGSGNGGRGADLSYAQWQYDRAAESLACFAPYYAPGDILFRKNVLDVGCGAGGKSVYYAEKWSADVTGVELLEKYRKQAEAFAMRKRIGTDPEARDTRDPYGTAPEARGTLDPYGADRAVRGSFRFICADASDTGLPAESFDTVIMNDAFEHLADPEAVLAECGRLLKPGGRVFMNFPPYGHPYGEHLSDLIGIPWVHKLFPEKDCLEAYRQLTEELDAKTKQDEPARQTGYFAEKDSVVSSAGTGTSGQYRSGRPAVNGAERIAFRLSEDENGELKNSYINKMTLKRFKTIREGIASQGSLRVILYKEKPLRKWLAPLAKIPGIKENFVRMAVCVLEKA